MTAKNWSVTMTELNLKREWGLRCEGLGLGYVFALQVNIAPAIRLVLFGWSIYAGRLLQVKTFNCDLGQIAESKGWVKDAQGNN